MRLVADPDFELWHGSAAAILAALPASSADAAVTSPPYGQTRDDMPALSPLELTQTMLELDRVCGGGPQAWNAGRYWRDGVEQLWWLDIVEAARAAGLELRDTRIWYKPNANPVRGELFTDSHELILCLGRPGAAFNTEAVRIAYQRESIARLERRYAANVGVKDGRRRQPERRSIGANPAGARGQSLILEPVGREKGNLHFTPMPLAVAESMVALVSWQGQRVVDPFCGSGTTALACRRLGRSSICIDIDERSCRMASRRLAQQALPV